MGSSKNITQKQKNKFLSAYEKSLGNITIACKAAGFVRSTFYLYKEKDKDFGKRVRELNESVGDFVESKLLKRINNNDITGIIFYCKTRLKSRGYIEKSEVEYSGDKNNPIQLKTVIEIAHEDIKLIEEMEDANPKST